MLNIKFSEIIGERLT